ncbi:hypothetical protein [Singulisphaera sp. PoT]|uniref:hypothetical protein n=1 Tax=Singulisphaera sp. PoT TaxID=3411797 RepID=UPI003BF5765A
MPTATAREASKLAAITMEPRRRRDFICHHIKRPERPQKTIAAAIASTIRA